METSGGFLVKVSYSEQKISVKTIPIQNDIDKVTDTQIKILELVKKNKYISASQMAVEVGISKRKIIYNINNLKSRQLIKRVGQAKGGYWEVQHGYTHFNTHHRER